MEKRKVITVGNHTIAIIHPETPGQAEIIQASILKGALKTSGTIYLNGSNWRLSTKQDFDYLRLSGYEYYKSDGFHELN